MNTRLPILTAGLGIAAGALGIYLLDPDQGRRRRAVLRDRLAGMTRRGTRDVGRVTRYAGSTTAATPAKVAHLVREPETPSDVALTDRVESELFRDPRIPKGDLNIDSVGGVVMIRGEVERPELINEIEERVRRISGVLEVRNLMHLPGTPAPHIV
jgi:osmotically-inducible protein OsmY